MLAYLLLLAVYATFGLPTPLARATGLSWVPPSRTLIALGLADALLLVRVLALSRDPERRIEIEWAAEKGDRFFVKLFMRGTDRRGLLSDVAKAITDTGTDISHADMRTTQGGMTGEFVVEVRDLAHLEKIRRSIGRVKGVLDVERREHFDEDDLGWA